MSLHCCVIVLNAVTSLIFLHSQWLEASIARPNVRKTQNRYVNIVKSTVTLGDSISISDTASGSTTIAADAEVAMWAGEMAEMSRYVPSNEIIHLYNISLPGAPTITDGKSHILTTSDGH